MALTEQQQQAIDTITDPSSRFAILTGGPGTGKTYTLGNWAKTYRERLTACAPTGKAAVRLTESLQSAGVNLRARTIHATLQPTRGGQDGEDWGFAYNSRQRLEYDTIILDEASMVDNYILRCLMEAVAPSTRVIFVGDPQQLSPVGVGRPFADMIASKRFPHAHLSEPHRFAGRIGQVCKSISEKTPWASSPSIDLDAESPENLLHIESRGRHESVAIEYLRKTIDRLITVRNFSPDDIQILCSTNDHGPVSRKPLNRILQGYFNPNGEPIADKSEFRVDDRVICLKNGAREVEDSQFASYVANGEMGRVIHGDNKAIYIRFEGSEFNTRFARNHWHEIALGYAITTHKSQGSGFPAVIYMIDSSGAAQRVCSQSHVYTGLSRASQVCITIGNQQTLRQYCSKIDIDKRKTFLREMLAG